MKICNQSNADRYKTEAKLPLRGDSSPTQQVVIVPLEVLDEKFDELASKLEKSLRNSSTTQQDEILTAKQAQELLHISPKQFYNLRVEGRIKFSQVGRKIYVMRSEIDTYLESHSINNKQSW